MAIKGEDLAKASVSFGLLPFSRQIGVLLGLAGSIALGVAVVLWAKEPNMRPLFASLASTDMAAVSDTLQQAGIEYRIDNQTGNLLVASDRVYDARSALSTKGLPKGGNNGNGALTQDLPMGSSQFVERIRYMNELENDLSRTISTFDNVKNAKVHIALPKQSSFIRDQGKPSASVLLDVYGGHALQPGQVDAVVHLIASSIPELAAEDITVVDQQGRLLTDVGGSESLTIADRQFRYTQQVEDQYAKKIEDLLIPLLGVGKVRARISADIDFAQNEQTRESFNPDLPALRSEQLSSEHKSDVTGNGAIPGALSNQPSSGPAKASESGKEDASAASSNSNERKQQVRNYELDKTISHTKQESGQVRHLSVAVLIDNRSKIDPESGEVKRTPLAAEELQRITKLVRDAIGYNVDRGDSVTIINSDFATPPEPEKLPELKIWEKPWFWNVVKQALGGIFVLLILFSVIRPIIKSLASRGLELQQMAIEQSKAMGSGSGRHGNDDTPLADLQAEALLSYDEQMRTVKGLATDDPKRVAQVVKKWLENE